LAVMTMKNYIIGLVFLLLPAFAYGMAVIKINDTMHLQNFSAIGYIRRYQESVLLNMAIEKLMQEGFERAEAEENFRRMTVLSGLTLSQNKFVPSENFSENDYIWFVKKPDQLYILRSRNTGDINLTLEPALLPNFDIDNPNFVVIDPAKPVMDIIRGYMKISLSNFLWNIDAGPKSLPQELVSISTS
jgi:hypothetical protein